MPNVEERTLTITEAAEFLKIKPQTLNSWRMNRTGPVFCRIGTKRGKVLYRLSALVDFLKENELRAAA
ncbi:MAG: helix-turn-helix domain-containing protein [Desulfuromonadaceae bacterium]